MKTYNIHEIFYSIQGEGLWSGKPMIFVRFFGCNLKCAHCDTPQEKARKMTASMIWEEADVLRPENEDVSLCLTGGEPLLQLDEDFLKAGTSFTHLNRAIHLETNGTLPLTRVMRYAIYWVNVSPKPKTVLRVSDLDINEMRFTYSQEDEDFILKTGQTRKGLIYVSPKNERFNVDWENVDKAVAFVKEHPQFKLSVQTHKLLKIR